MLIFSQLSVVNLDDVKSVKVRVLLETRHGHWQMLSGGLGFTDGSVVKNPPANTGDAGLISGSERFPGGGNGNPLQSSGLENLIHRGTCCPTVHRVVKESDRTQRLNKNNWSVPLSPASGLLNTYQHTTGEVQWEKGVWGRTLLRALGQDAETSDRPRDKGGRTEIFGPDITLFKAQPIQLS